MVTVDGQLAVVALDVVAIGLHQVAVGVGEIPLGFGRRCAIGLSRQPTTRHRFYRQRFQIRWLQACFLGGLDRLLSCGFRFGCCRLSSLVQFRLLSR